ncbi:MAG TPA: DUF805 domain-containing protein [Stellaceae bacterium]|jgi:uncharacterized membrane protein YhaH (DUF805 family)|nr:DUF805 domain-containing protein [Stellaceae bacterium]
MQPSLSQFLLSAKGRISRSQFWLRWALPYIVATVVLEILLFMLFDPWVAMILLYVYLLAMLWPSIAVSIKRVHDRGRSGWFILLMVVPFLNIWVMIEMLFLPGTSGNNGYGADPATA